MPRQGLVFVFVHHFMLRVVWHHMSPRNNASHLLYRGTNSRCAAIQLPSTTPLSLKTGILTQAWCVIKFNIVNAVLGTRMPHLRTICPPPFLDARLWRLTHCLLVLEIPKSSWSHPTHVIWHRRVRRSTSHADIARLRRRWRSILIVKRGSIHVGRVEIAVVASRSGRHLTVQTPDLRPISVLLKGAIEHLFLHLKINLPSKQRIRSCLMRLPDACNCQLLSDVLEPRLCHDPLHDEGSVVGQWLIVIHRALGANVFQDVLDVEERWEEFFEERMERRFVFGQGLAYHELHQVAKVIGRVEGNPVNVILQHKTRCHE